MFSQASHCLWDPLLDPPSPGFIGLYKHGPLLTFPSNVSFLMFSGQRTRFGHQCSTITQSWRMCGVQTLRSPTPWLWIMVAAWSSWKPWLTAQSTVSRRWPTIAEGPACSTHQVRLSPSPLCEPCRMTTDRPGKHGMSRMGRLQWRLFTAQLKEIKSGKDWGWTHPRSDSQVWPKGRLSW